MCILRAPLVNSYLIHRFVHKLRKFEGISKEIEENKMLMYVELLIEFDNLIKMARTSYITEAFNFN